MKNKKTYPIDITTGLPLLPEGQFWEVDTHYWSSMTLYLKYGKNYYEASYPLHVKNGKPITKEDILNAAITILQRIDKYKKQEIKKQRSKERKKAIKYFFWNLIFIKTIQEWFQNNVKARRKAQYARYKKKREASDAKWRAERQMVEEAIKASHQFIGEYPPKNLNDI